VLKTAPDVAHGDPAGSLARTGLNRHQEWLQRLTPLGFGQFAGDRLLGQGYGLPVVVNLVEQVKGIPVR
jgi:hypothetical protein